MNIISNLLGDNKEARDLKADFLKIAVVNNLADGGKMVHGRGIGKEKKTFKQAV